MKYICSDCGYLIKPTTIYKGSLLNEIGLWLLFGIGFFYSIWRGITKYNGCPKCYSKNIYSIDSPRGKQLKVSFNEFNSTQND